MTGRRGVLMGLTAVAVPGLARAQQPSMVPPAVTPLSPPAPFPAAPQPARQPPIAGAAIDKTRHYYLFFDQAIDVASMRALRRQLTNLVEAGVAEITLVLDSSGGLLEQMLVTYSLMRSLPVKINTHAQGFVSSAATVLFLAGEERSADSNAQFVFHPWQSTVGGMMAQQQMRESLMQLAAVARATSVIYKDRTSLSDQEIERFGRETVIYTAEQAKLAGVVQTVADLKIPGGDKSKILFLD